MQSIIIINISVIGPPPLDIGLLLSNLCLIVIPFRTWQEEEEAEETPPHPRPLESENRRSHPPLPWNHRVCRLQGVPPRKDRFHRRCLRCHQEASRI